MEMWNHKKTSTRVQGLIMIIRLKGEEAEALEANYSHPFRDVEGWADPYVAFGYQRGGYVNGTSPTEFSPDKPIEKKAFLTILMRALNYSDDIGDFSYDNVINDVKSLSLFAYDEYTWNNTFIRRDMFLLIYNALFERPKGNSDDMIDLLVDKNVLSSSEANTYRSTYFKKKNRINVTYSMMLLWDFLLLKI